MAELIVETNPMWRGRILPWVLEQVGAPFRTELPGFGPPMKAWDYLAASAFSDQ